MGKINVAVECEAEHRASIFALVTSIVLNKDIHSEYCIYLMLNNTDKKQWEALLELGYENVEFVFLNDGIDKLRNVDKLILLKWNTLVTGDLSELYNIDLKRYAFGAVETVRVIQNHIPGEKENYNTSVLLVDTKKYGQDSNYIKISEYYNYEVNDGCNEATKMEEMALILRMNSEKSSEIYFDGPADTLWMKYYKKSPIGNMLLNRKAYVDTVGTAFEGKVDVIPVLINVEDNKTENVISLIKSIESNLSSDKLLDVRIVYNQLSLANQKLLMSLVSNRLNMLLYNVSRYTKTNIRTCKEILATKVFSDYDKAVCIEANVVLKEDIGSILDSDLSGVLIKGQKCCEDDSKDIFVGSLAKMNMDITVVNIKQWIDGNIDDKLQQLLDSDEYAAYDKGYLLNLVCLKKRAFFDKELMYGVENINLDEDNEVKEVLLKMQELEKENQYLADMNKKLKSDNKKLEDQNCKLARERESYLNEIFEIRKSMTYRFGRILTFIPRKLRGDK